MKHILVANVYARCVIVEHAQSPPVGAKLLYVHPVYEIYQVKHVWSVEGRAHEIRHACLIAVQDAGHHAGDVRYAGPQAPRKSRKSNVSSRQLPLWPTDGFLGDES